MNEPARATRAAIASALRAAIVCVAVVLACSATSGADAPPHVTSISIVPADLRSGDHVTATVFTSGDATAVVAHVNKRDIAVPRVKNGVFSGSAIVPRIPRFIHLHVNVTFEALGPTGASDEKTMSVKVN